MKTGTNQPAAPSELPRTTPPPRHGLSPHPVPGHLCEGGCTSLPLLDQIRLNPTKSDQIRVKKIEKCRPSGHSRKGLAPSVANPCSSVAPHLCEGGSYSPEESTCAAVAPNRKQSCPNFFHRAWMEPLALINPARSSEQASIPIPLPNIPLPSIQDFSFHLLLSAHRLL